MKVLLTSIRFFNSMQEETLPNQASTSTQTFGSIPTTSAGLRTPATCVKLFDPSEKLDFSLEHLFIDCYSVF